MPRSYHFVINKLAGSYTPERENHLVKSLENRGIVPVVHNITESGDAARLASRICGSEEYPFIIVGGGDGTINGVINGLVFGKATVALAPLGRSNLLAREVGITSLDDAVERIVNGSTRSPAVGLLQTDRKKRYFLLMAGIGFDGFICQAVSPSEMSLLGKGAYLLAALRRFVSWERERLELYVDEMRIDCHGVVICNAAHYGGGFILAPDSDLFSPEFQVVCMKDDRRRTYLRLIVNTLAGKYPDTTEVRRFSAFKLVVTGKKAVQIDGDYYGYSPLRISCVEQLFKLVV